MVMVMVMFKMGYEPKGGENEIIWCFPGRRVEADWGEQVLAK